MLKQYKKKQILLKLPNEFQKNGVLKKLLNESLEDFVKEFLAQKVLKLAEVADLNRNNWGQEKNAEETLEDWLQPFLKESPKEIPEETLVKLQKKFLEELLKDSPGGNYREKFNSKIF